MRGAMVGLLAVFVVAAFSSAGCSSRKKKRQTHQSLQIATTALPDATEGVAYSFTVQATGGSSANYTWGISGQPSWLTIDSATGELSGTPPAGSAGTYTFTVEVTDGQDRARKQFALTVNEPLKADFEANPTEGIAPLTVAFTDKSTGSPTSWEWDFDNDGTVDSTQQSPTYTYNNPGWYTVKLTVSDGTDTDTCVKEMYIQVTANIYYVDGVNGDDGNGGTGWSDAFATIGKALDVAGDYDVVLVADATYNETDLNFKGKKIYLKGVDHNVTGQQPVIDCQSNGRAFYFGSGETKDSVIDNFTIQNGKVTDTYGGAVVCENNSSPTITNCVFQNDRTVMGSIGSWETSGGAIACWDSSSPSIANCTFSGNHSFWYGGAIFCRSSSPTVTNCTFSGNGARCSGGAIACYCFSKPIITNCAFSGNSALQGGAIACSESSPSIRDCTFSGNSVSGSYAYGGAIYCYYGGGSITGCTFSANNAPHGGAIYCKKSGPSITDCIFSGNSASGSGGAIYCYQSSPMITNSTFSGNSANGHGGAIYCDASSPTLTNCTFSGNSATDEGGAIYSNSSSPSITNCTFSNNSANRYGGAIYCDASSPTLTNCTFSGNDAWYDGGAIYCDNSGSPTLNNCILWNNSAGSRGNEIYVYDLASSCTLNYCCVDNNGYGFGSGGTIDDGNNCVFDDPQFMDAAGGDYHLKDTSPCIDTGDNSLVPSSVTTDLDGRKRIVDGDSNGTATVDIGAYEYQP